MDILTVSETTWRGVPAWRVRAKGLACVVTRQGGHLASLCDPADGVEAFWQPPWLPGDPADSASGTWGDPPEAKLLATIVGHNWCCDRFGGPWPGEDKPVHGEAGIVPWRLVSSGPYRVAWEADLPLAKLRARKEITIDADRLDLMHALAHEGSSARAVEWAEHVNLGDPFLDGAEIDAGVDRLSNWPHGGLPSSRFPTVEAEGDVPIARGLAMPGVEDPPAGDILCGRLREGWFAATNRRLRRRLVYVWNQEDYPWLTVWTEHRSRHHVPWNGRTRARGMEFSTKPWPEGQPPASRAETYQGRPTTCLIPPGSWREHRMVIAWKRI